MNVKNNKIKLFEKILYFFITKKTCKNCINAHSGYTNEFPDGFGYCRKIQRSGSIKILYKDIDITDHDLDTLILTDNDFKCNFWEGSNIWG